MLFPINEPFNKFFLDVGHGHKLYVVEFGNPKGFPVVYLHGGPGAGHNPAFQKSFNPDFYRIIMFDQRGCGQSTPFASLEQNTIGDLVDDIEKLRRHLGIEKWTVGGGSWGSALAMFYTRKYPDVVQNMLLRGLFFATREGADWIGEEGKTVPKDQIYFDDYRDLIPEDIRARDGLIKSYDRIMKNGSYAEQCEAAKRFMIWDTSIAFYNIEDALPHIENIQKNPEAEIPITKFYLHYTLNEYDDRFKSELLSVEAFRHIPIDLIHGEDDRICPVSNTFDFCAGYPHAKAHIVKGAGHAGADTGMSEATAQVSEAMRRILEMK